MINNQESNKSIKIAVPSVDKEIKQCIKFWSESTKVQGSEQFRSTLNYYKSYSGYNPFTTEYQGFPSYYHLMVFFNAVEDKLGCNDYYTFSTKKVVNPKDLELKERICKMNAEQLLDFMDKQKEEKLLELENASSDIYFKYIPGIIVQGRYLPQNAAYLLFKWLSWIERQLKQLDDEEYSAIVIARCNLIHKLKLLLGWKAMNGSGMESLIQLIESDAELPTLTPQTSYMKESFKPTIPLPPIKFEVINKILTDAEQEPLDPTKDMKTISEYYLLLERLEKLCGISGESFVKFSIRKRKGGYPERKNTLTAVYKTLTHKERIGTLHKSLWHFKKYNKAVSQAGKLRGRLENCFSPFIASVSTKIDKSGLATRFFTSEYYLFNNIKDILQTDTLVDIPSVVFVSLAVSEFSVRKAFTIDSQQQGGLDDALQYLMNLLKGRETQTRWELIASLLPVEDVISRISDDLKNQIFSQLLTYQIQMAKFLKQQWEAGVSKCCQKDMMVPRRGTTSVDTSGWNSTAGAWNNSIRFIRAISKSLGQEPPLLMKCMKLTAADQMQWAQMAGKDEPEDVPVFKKLTLEMNITPWGIVLQSGDFTATKQDIIKACEECKVDPKRWLGFAQERTMETKLHGDMICGCAVPNDAIYQNLLKLMGAFGYKPPKQQE